MARPNKGLGHVDALTGDPEYKWRLQVILATLTGEMAVDEACDDLELGETQFGTLRKRVLQGALDAFSPRAVGRPRKEAEVSVVELAALRAENAELERQMAEMRARVEVALLPFLGGERGGKRRKKAPPAPYGLVRGAAVPTPRSAAESPHRGPAAADHAGPAAGPAVGRGASAAALPGAAAEHDRDLRPRLQGRAGAQSAPAAVSAGPARRRCRVGDRRNLDGGTGRRQESPRAGRRRAEAAAGDGARIGARGARGGRARTAAPPLRAAWPAARAEARQRLGLHCGGAAELLSGARHRADALAGAPAGLERHLRGLGPVGEGEGRCGGCGARQHHAVAVRPRRRGHGEG